MRALLLALLLAGCMKTSDKYCASHHEDLAHCPTPDGGGSCMIDGDCAAMIDTPACDTGSHTCVACVMNDACKVSTLPVCNAMHACEACDANSDCPDSLACLPDGSCAATDTVAYVDPTGGGSDCTRQLPCDKLSKALSKGRPVIKVSGAVDEGTTITDHTAKLTIIGDPGARIFRSNSGTILAIAGTSNVVVSRLTIGAAAAMATAGVSLDPGASGSLELRHVVVTNNNVGGVRVEQGTIGIYNSTITANLGGGVIVRSTANGYTIRNNFIVDNGKGSGTGQSAQGGALLEADVGGKFEYNTVAFNGSSGASSIRPGVQCSGTNSAVGNLVVANSDNLMGTNDGNQTGGTCSYGNTYKAGLATPVGFLAPAATPPDLHLTAGSPTTVRDAAGDCSAFVTTDVDGQARPYNGMCDLGADEYMP